MKVLVSLRSVLFTHPLSITGSANKSYTALSASSEVKSALTWYPRITRTASISTPWSEASIPLIESPLASGKPARSRVVTS